MAADIKRPAFCWQDKATLRRIRENCENYSSALAVYVALTVVASDQESDTFQTTHDWLGQLSGFGWRTVLERLKDLQRIGVVQISTPKLKIPSTYRLCRPAMVAQRSATNAERSAKIGPLPMQSSEEIEEKTLPSASNSGLKALWQEEMTHV
jgi:hypothetical protein